MLAQVLEVETHPLAKKKKKKELSLIHPLTPLVLMKRDFTFNSPIDALFAFVRHMCAYFLD